jgi:hypothetical protein
MKEQLITLETAKLAKEKGFDIAVQHFYDKEGNLDICGYDNWNKGFGEACSCSSQSLLQKWLREKYNMHLLIKAPVLTKQWECHIETPFRFTHPTHYYQIGNSYEEALEKGLYEALKLIEIN